ncbi:MAG: 3-deoxy-D-manno-octulosonate 8-phosphate phosphatase (KDO 8-P phosphatase) [Halioglobus sp.]|jgi:3-deoxy-D-manno-octulosonate 8-phosphate phosphatase (KDO 8-P phosphatase)
MSAVKLKAENIKLLVLDVDGVLTDGSIYYGNSGEELKSFSIKDGLGIKMLQQAGINVAIITGRQSAIVTRRANELGIVDIIQGREDKRSALVELCTHRNLDLSDCAYMGDDLPDLSAIISAGLGLTVADASKPVLDAADWVSRADGGDGAVREACEFILAAQDSLDSALAQYR